MWSFLSEGVLSGEAGGGGREVAGGEVVVGEGLVPLIGGGRAGHIDMAGVRQDSVWITIPENNVPDILKFPVDFRGVVYHSLITRLTKR